MNFKKISFLVALVSLALVACGDKSESSKKGTQVVAKVNGEEISIHQVNLQLSRLGPLDEAKSKVAAKEILTKLVQQQMVKQEAIKAKLDRDPRILQIVEASKDDILSQAYLEQVAAKAAKPSESQIDTFYQEHPELFEKRRAYRLQELVISVEPNKHAEVMAEINKLKSLNEIAAYIKSKNFPVNANSNVKTAEQIPANLLEKLKNLNDGQFIVLPNNSLINVIHLVASQTQPITKDKAKPIIEQYFFNTSKTTLLKNEMDTLKKNSKIEYVGEFSDMNVASGKETKQETAEKATSKAEVAVQAPESKPKDAAASNIDKGLAGF